MVKSYAHPPPFTRTHAQTTSAHTHFQPGTGWICLTAALRGELGGVTVEVVQDSFDGFIYLDLDYD